MRKLGLRMRLGTAGGLALTLGVSMAHPAMSAAPPTIRVSVDKQGGNANGGSGSAAISSDGTFVAFQSAASDLVAGDTNGRSDSFIRNIPAGVTTRVSVATDGTQGNGDSVAPAISGNGQCAVFYSDASNLVSGDTDGVNDVFVRNLATHTTSMVSVTYDGSVQDGDSHFPSISSDCRYVAFRSRASNIVPDDTNGKQDIFYRDLQTGVTTRVSVAADGGNANKESRGASISADGHFVAFHSYATNLIPGGADANDKLEVYVRDMVAGVTTRVSVDMDGGDPNCDSRTTVGNTLSDSAQSVVFQSCATDLVPNDHTGGRNQIYDTFIKDMQTGITTRLSVDYQTGGDSNGDSRGSSVSGDGNFVAFHSSSSDLVPDDTNPWRDIFLWSRATGTLTRVSVDYQTGGDANGFSKGPSLSATGLFVAFGSNASDLVPSDANGATDAFRVDLSGLR